MYKFYEDDHAIKYEARYWNCQGTNIAIVASITVGIDWAAYIGAEADARYFFPDIELPYRH